MRTVHTSYLKSHLLQSVAVLIAAAASMNAAQAQTQTIATPPNVNAINLVLPFTTLLGSTTINQTSPPQFRSTTIPRLSNADRRSSTIRSRPTMAWCSPTHLDPR
jgi:hypothetical protein